MSQFCAYRLFFGESIQEKASRIVGTKIKEVFHWMVHAIRPWLFDTARFNSNMNYRKTPKFPSGREQFTEEDVLSDRRICKLRYTCEVAFSRVTKTRGLWDVISNDFSLHLDVINHWGHATINLDAPLMKIK